MRRRRLIFAVGLLLLFVTVGGWYGVSRYRARSASLVSLFENRRSYADGRDAQLLIARNANDDPAAVVVAHFSTVDPSRRVLKDGRLYSSNDPIEGLLSSCRVTTHFPADPEVSGVWVDGRKRRIGERLLVVYVSDRNAATDIHVADDEESSLLGDAKKLDPMAFIEKWITPRLPAAE